MPSQISSVDYFLNHVFDSPYGDILATYTDVVGFPITAKKTRVTDSVIVNGKKGNLGGTLGTYSDDVLGIVGSLIKSKRLPLVSPSIMPHALSCLSTSAPAEHECPLHRTDRPVGPTNGPRHRVLYRLLRLALRRPCEQGHAWLHPARARAAHPLHVDRQPADAVPGLYGAARGALWRQRRRRRHI